MARVAVEIPKVGLVMENARVVRWLKNVGDAVRQGEPLLELETEKSVIEVESAESGRLVEILLDKDQSAQVGDLVAWLENDAPAVEGPLAPRAEPVGESSPATPVIARQASEPLRIKSSPAARQLAARHAIDLKHLPGSGPGGRVQLADVHRVIDSRGNMTSTPVAEGGFEPLTPMRRALARSTTLSNAVPQFSVERAVDWSALQIFRANLDQPDEARPSINDFLLQAIARTLLEHPDLNVLFQGEGTSPDAGMVRVKGAHIGLVVAANEGLLVPTFHGVERLGLRELARRRADVVARAQKGRLSREELEGATISISNLGKNGPDRFNALVHAPQSAILAVGRRTDGVVARNGVVAVRPLSQLTLTVDHRVADGRLASDFLATLVGLLEGEVWQL